jgi:DNA modification methylase
MRDAVTKLVWPGKYDEQGRPHPIERTVLPFQIAEVVKEVPEEVRPFPPSLTHPDRPWRNSLIWGDNKLVASSLLPHLLGKVNLIYIDPPFATGQEFALRTRIGDEECPKRVSAIKERAYRDIWRQGLESYLRMMYERLALMRDLLTDNGSIYVHLDWHAGHYVKIIMDEIFGRENFRNEIVWCYRTMQTTKSGWARKHDIILYYTGGNDYVFNLQEVLEPYPDDYERRFRYTDDQGRRFMIRGKGGPFGMGQGDLRQEDEQRYPQFTYRQYMQEGSIPKDWWEVDMLNSNSRERLGFETQKPEALLERIIRASSNPGDLVADFFCGSGTTLAVAERLGRRWIGCDLSRQAIQISCKRLLQLEACGSFEILRLGNYEQHKLASHECGGDYVRFILQLYRAEAIAGFANLHGKKARAYVHVGSVDRPITPREICQTIREARRVGAHEVHCLGWDFEMGLKDLVSQAENDYGLKVRLVFIPRKSLEVTNPAREEVRFFHLNYLDLGHELKGKTFLLCLKDFVIGNPEHLSEEVRARVKTFTDCIDYWAVDWDYNGNIFHNQWYAFRTRQNPKLATKATHTYELPGTYRVLVKVVDILGNDTTKMVEVQIP